MKSIKTCPNKKCEYYGKFIRGNIILFGKQKNNSQRYKCTSCNKTFSDNTDSPNFYTHITKEELKQISMMLAQKMSYRKIAKATNRHLDTIRSMSRRMIKNSSKFKKYLIKELKMSPKQVKNTWNSLKQRTRKNL